MKITISHRGKVLAECKTDLEALEQEKKWSCIFKPLEVKVKK